MMQHGGTAILALLLAHVLAHFPLQTEHMLQAKGTKTRRVLFKYLSIHFALSILLLALFTSVPILRGSTMQALALLIGGHGLLELGKSMFVRARPQRDGWLLFTADQLAHVVVVIAAAALLPEVTFQANSLAAEWNAVRDRVLVDTFVLVVVTFPTGYLIRYLLAPLGDKLDGPEQPEPDDTEHQGLENAGLYLGWIERALLLIAFSNGSFQAIGLILAAKSVARFPDFKQRAFAEYFLIGTLLSVIFAGLGAFGLHVLRAAL